MLINTDATRQRDVITDQWVKAINAIKNFKALSECEVIGSS